MSRMIKKREHKPISLRKLPICPHQPLYNISSHLLRRKTSISKVYLSPSSLDMELRMLQIIDDDDEQEPEKRPEFLILELVLEYLIHEVSHGNNFEFIRSLIRLFLKIHGETMRRHSKLHKLLEAQSAIWQKLDGLFQSARCMVTFLSNSQF